MDGLLRDDLGAACLAGGGAALQQLEQRCRTALLGGRPVEAGLEGVSGDLVTIPERCSFSERQDEISCLLL